MIVVMIMTKMDPLADALSAIMNAELVGKHRVVVPRTKLVSFVLREFKKHNYVKSFKIIEDGHGGRIEVELMGRINKCGVIKPRYPVRAKEIYAVAKEYLPARGIGYLIISTPEGIMTHEDAIQKNIGGRLIAYVY